MTQLLNTQDFTFQRRYVQTIGDFCGKNAEPGRN